jgi:hypothetical protein
MSIVFEWQAEFERQKVLPLCIEVEVSRTRNYVLPPFQLYVVLVLLGT